MVRTHALFFRLTRHSWWPGLHGFGAITGASWAITLALAVLPVWRRDVLMGEVIPLVQGISFGLMLIIPPVTAAYAATLASAAVVRPEYALVRLTHLPKKAIVMDLYHAALYRLRGLYAVQLALLPALLLSGLYKGMVIGRQAVTSSGIVLLGAGVWFGLAALLGAALGVYIALRWRHPPGPLVAAPVVLLAMMGLSAVCLVCPFFLGAPVALMYFLNQAEKYA